MEKANADAGNLVNGITIVDNARPNAFVLNYFHIELKTHEVILAEGLPVESFHGGSRRGFDNEAEMRRFTAFQASP